MIFRFFIRIVYMETKIEQQFTHWSYEMTVARRKFDNMIVATATTILLTIVLLVVDFYEIPYVLTGILPYVINLGLLLLPFFGLGIYVTWEKSKNARLIYDVARLQLIQEIQARCKGELTIKEIECNN